MSTAGATLAVPPPLTLHGGSSQSVTLTANSAAGPGASTQSLRAALRTRDLRFWLVFVAITVSTFLSAIDTVRKPVRVVVSRLTLLCLDIRVDRAPYDHAQPGTDASARP